MRLGKIRRVMETVSAMACIVAGVVVLRWVVWEGEGPLALAWGGMWLIGIPPLIVAQRAHLKNRPFKPPADGSDAP